MKERGILFSAPMVLALLDGRKTQTRRLVNPKMYLVVDGDETTGRIVEQSDPQFGKCAEEYAPCPYGQPGDRLWVRETWCHLPWSAGAEKQSPKDEYVGIRYRATWDRSHHLPWIPAIHMFRWASRITLEITDVRVQRVQDISEEDALAEGCDGDCGVGNMRVWAEMGRCRYHFAGLWDDINGKRAPWSDNPWVWCISFKRVKP